MSSSHQLIRSLFEESIREVDVATAVEREIQCAESDLSICGRRFERKDIDRIEILAVGKAATPMFEAAAKALSSWIEHEVALYTTLVGPVPPKHVPPNLTFFQGAHPTPNEISRRAADAVVERLRAADERTLVLFLISGGASAMLESPLDQRISPAETAEFNRALVASGLSIKAMNILRKHFSAVKGGRLAAAAGRAAAQCTLIVSDLPEGSIEYVGSGPSLADSSTNADCLEVLSRLGKAVSLPPRVISFFESPSLPETLKPNDPIFARSCWRGILSSADLAEAANRIALEARFHVEVDNTCDEWGYREAGRYLLDRITSVAPLHPRSCLLSVGEISVPLDKPGGRGGRNQHFALWCALVLAGSRHNIKVLSAGSDGIDGNSPAAGAVADPTTCERAYRLGLDPQASLAAFDSFALFDALGDTIVTGPTGNNVRDLRIFLAER